MVSSLPKHNMQKTSSLVSVYGVHYMTLPRLISVPSAGGNSMRSMLVFPEPWLEG